MNNKYMDWLTRLPKNQLSQAVGKVVELKLPKPLSSMSVASFAKYYNINLEEAEKPISEYRSIADLFTRRLKPGCRPIEADLVHPADSVITEAGYAADGILIQAKGITYSVESLLADRALAERLHGGIFATYYLCPTDYHRVHSPVSGKVLKSIYVPGTLWPVNAWSVKHVRQLFAINERLVTVIESETHGLMACVMVGATNVGKMTVAYDPTILTNSGQSNAPISKSYTPPVSIKVGDELGVFHMGSTVIMVCEADRIKVDPRKLVGQVRMGQKLIP